MNDGKSLSILVIEDNLINQKLASTLFKRIGHAVDVALNGKIGVELYETKHYDLILMDIQMPVMTGIEATLHIRNIEKKRQVANPTVIIAVTTFNYPLDKENCLNAGMNDHISKPYKPIDLLNTVARHIKHFVIPEYM
ncbi:MAG: response regulator [Bacteroidales bacterium]|nr:response regulator [Bacteroidales bacterium]